MIQFQASFSSTRFIATSAALLKYGRFRYFNRRNIDIKEPKTLEPNYFEKQAAAVDLSPTYIDTLGAIWEKRENTVRDKKFKFDDQIVGNEDSYNLPPIDSHTPVVGFEDIEELNDASDSVKKIFSIQYGDRKSATDFWVKSFMDKCKVHPLESSSTFRDAVENEKHVVLRIAVLTARIRSLTQLLLNCCGRRRPGWARHQMYLAVSTRRRLLQRLKNEDYEQFERVIEVLGLRYVEPLLAEDQPEFDTRKSWIEFQCKIKAESLKQERLIAYHDELASQQAAFISYRDEARKKLANERRELEEEKQKLETILYGEKVDTDKVYIPSTVDSISEQQMFRHYYQNVDPEFSSLDFQYFSNPPK